MDDSLSDDCPCCILCGLEIYIPDWFYSDNVDFTFDTLWISEFRAVYTENDDWMNPKLSGVGLRDIRPNKVPIDPNSRYDDPNLEQNSVVPITLFKTVFNNGPTIPHSTTEKSYSGFAFHDACWTLLKAVHEPNDIDIRLLNNLCRSCPIIQGLLNWGHDYSGKVQYMRDLNDLSPGQVPLLYPCYTYESMPDGGELSQASYFYNPLEIPGFTQILDDSFASTRLISQEKREAFTIPLHIQDPFTRLPVEILQIILMELPSKDVLNFKLASRVVSNIPLPGSFFASRFDPDFEFHQIFEARKYPVKSHHWKMLYMKAKELSKTHNFRNRKQIWVLLLQLQDLLTELSQRSLEGSLSRSFFEPNAPNDGLFWRFASGNLKGPEQLFTEGCRALWTRHINLPREISNIFVSFIELNGPYICGLRFQQKNGDDICLGYIYPKSEVALATGHLNLAGDGQNVHGIKLAVDDEGFRAISLLMNRELNVKWRGVPNGPYGTPKMRLVNMGSDLTALKAGFDGLKMVSLGIPNGQPTECGRESTPVQYPALRDTTQWFPDIPTEELYLNESSFVQHTTQIPPFWPLTMVLHGGLRGCRLQIFMGISVCIINKRLASIHFIYSREVEGQKIHSIGCCGERSSDEERRTHGIPDTLKDWHYDFPIDGQDGEMIEKVDIQWTESHEMQALRIRTNRERIATFPPNPEEDLPFSKVAVAEGTTITGFYSYVEGGLYLRNLGVISEAL